MGTDSPVIMDWSSRISPAVMRTSAATTPPSESFTTSPGTSSAAGTVVQAPSRRTDALSASRDFSAARVAWARPSWRKPRTALKTRRLAMIPASAKSPSANWSTTAASSIHGTGAQNLPSALRSGSAVVSGVVFGPKVSSRRRASSLLRPLGRPSIAASADLAGKALAEGGGAVVAIGWWETPCHHALRRLRDVGQLGRILPATASPIAYRKSCPPFKTTLLSA